MADDGSLGKLGTRRLYAFVQDEINAIIASQSFDSLQATSDDNTKINATLGLPPVVQLLQPQNGQMVVNVILPRLTETQPTLLNG